MARTPRGQLEQVLGCRPACLGAVGLKPLRTAQNHLGHLALIDNRLQRIVHGRSSDHSLRLQNQRSPKRSEDLVQAAQRRGLGSDVANGRVDVSLSCYQSDVTSMKISSAVSEHARSGTQAFVLICVAQLVRFRASGTQSAACVAGCLSNMFGKRAFWNTNLVTSAWLSVARLNSRFV